MKQSPSVNVKWHSYRTDDDEPATEESSHDEYYGPWEDHVGCPVKEPSWGLSFTSGANFCPNCGTRLIRD